MDTSADRLKAARKHHGLYATPTEASRAHGWKSTYLGHENGDRPLSVRAAKRYAKVYGVRWQWLFEGQGAMTEKLQVVPIVGVVERNSQVRILDNPALNDSAPLPPNGGSTTVALAVQGASMRGIADDGWLFYFDQEKRPPTKDLFGKLCVIELTNGEIFIRVLQPGRRRGAYDLESTITQDTLRDQRVAWAARVTWIKPR